MANIFIVFKVAILMSEFESLRVRPLASRDEYILMLDYFYGASDSFLTGMGVDRSKFLSRERWLELRLLDHERPDDEKDRFYLIWEYKDEPVGHSSISDISVGNQASIHLHLWKPELRRAGLGTELVRRSVKFYFERFGLQKLVCEPWAENPAPNRVLQKLGFKFVRQYRTTPGPICFEQEVNRYELLRSHIRSRETTPSLR